MSDKPKLDLNEIIGLSDEVIAVANGVRDLVSEARAAREDGEITPDEIQALETKANALVDAAQRLASEIIREATD